MSDLAAEVTAALRHSILPSVIARGATAIRVVAAEDGVVTLQADGSPGAVRPILGRIEAQIRAAVPAVTAVRLAAAGPAPPEAGDVGRTCRGRPRLLDAEVNPAIAAHRGRVSVAGVAGGWIRVRLEGGCQGCSLAEVTLRQGIEPVLRARLPASDRARRRHRARGGHRAVLLPGETVTAPPRVLLLVPARTYRAADFILAAERMRLDLVVASDGALPLGGRRHPGPFGRSRCQRPPDPGPGRGRRRGGRRRHPDARAGRDRGRPDGPAA